QYALDINGQRLRVTDALNSTMRYDYDSRGLLIRSQTAMGVVMEYGYDAMGNKIRETNALSDSSLQQNLQPVYAGGLPATFMVVPDQLFQFTLPANYVTVVGSEALNYRLEVYKQVNTSFGTQYQASTDFTLGTDNRTIVGTPTAYGDYYISVVVTVPSTGVEIRINTTLSSPALASLVGKPFAREGIADQVIATGQSLNLSIPATAFADPSNQALTYTGQIGYYVPAVLEYDAESGTYFTSQRARWAYRNITGSDWVQFNTTTRTFTGTAPGGEWHLLVTATDTEGKTAEIEINGRQPNLYTRATVDDAEEVGGKVYLHEQSWNYDAFGRVRDYNDLSGIDYNYNYNAQSGAQIEQSIGWTDSNTATTVSSYTFGNIIFGSPTQAAVLSTGLRQTSFYLNGMVREIKEGNKIYSYNYDAGGNRILERTITLDANGQALTAATRMTYDSHNRLQRVTQDIEQDGSNVTVKRILDLWYDYDAVGNRRRVSADGAFAAGAPPIAMTNTSAYLVNPIDSRNVRANTPTSFNMLVSDVFRDRELDPLSLSVVQVINGVESARPSWLTYSVDNNGRLVFNIDSISSAAIGSNVTVRLKATDSTGSNQTVSTDFVLNIVNNSTPTFGNTPFTAIARFDRAFSLELTPSMFFKDSDAGDMLTLSLGTTLPAWLQLDTSIPGRLRLYGTPSSANAGTLNLSLIARDQMNASATKNISIQVQANASTTATAPVLAPQTVITQRMMNWQVNATDMFTDADADALTYTATLDGGAPLPSWLSFTVDYNGSQPALKLNGVPPTSYPNNTVVTVRIAASDGQSSASKTLALTIRHNSAPTSAAGFTPPTAKLNTTFLYEISAASIFTDLDADTLSYSLNFGSNNPSAQWLTMTYD
ncbi:MAG: putative Ig domain-containing protein, partial [Arenimonas sp.]